MLLGIEIGGAKLQLGIGRGDGSPLVALERLDVEPEEGAAGILDQIETAARPLLKAHSPEAVGVGFGGPVDMAKGRVIKSHHVRGWDGFQLAAWCQEKIGLPTVVANDADVAALAEAAFGAGKGANPVFYVTVGSGIGGGLVVDGAIFTGGANARAEIGHLRPGLAAERPDETVESIASGWGIAAAARRSLDGGSRTLEIQNAQTHVDDLTARCHGVPQTLTAKMVYQAAGEGNAIAQQVIQKAATTLGWAIAQTISLAAPQRVVVGGGVSLAGERLFFLPLRAAAGRYVFPPLADSYDIAPAQLGEEVVPHGAIALAAQAAL